MNWRVAAASPSIQTSVDAAQRNSEESSQRPHPASATRAMQDAPGLPRFFRSMQKELQKYFVRRLGDADLAADYVQDTFLRFTRMGYGVDGVAARALIFGIARNLFTDHLRRRRRQGLLGFDEVNHLGPDALAALASPVANPEQTISARQELDRALGAIGELPPKCRQVFIMHRLHGRSHKEIASELAITVSMVEKHIIEATARLVKALAP